MGGDETYKVEEYTRFAHNTRLVVLRPGQTIPMALAVEYGLAGKKAKPDGEKPVEQFSGAECDAKAAELGVDPWDAKAKVPAKREALAWWIAGHDDGEGKDS